MKYYVYLIETTRGTIYTGITTDVNRRYQEHLAGSAKKGAKYTNANKPLRILCTMEFETKSEAMKEEYRIKRLTHKAKMALAEGININS